MFCVVEFHGFKDNFNDFIVKELAIVGADLIFNCVYKSPYSRHEIFDQRGLRWLENRFHHVRWEDGSIEFNRAHLSLLLKPYDKVYTKGFEKTEFLRRFHRHVEDIDSTVKYKRYSRNEMGKAYSDQNPACCVRQHNVTENSRCSLKSAIYYYRIQTSAYQQEHSQNTHYLDGHQPETLV